VEIAQMVKQALKKPVESMCGLLMVLITLVIFLQVISRYVFQHPFDWPEELARFLFVWVALLGAALALKRGVHFSIDALVKRFSGGWQLSIAISVQMMLSLFILTIALKGFQLAMKVKDQLSPGMEISMTLPYLSVPVSFTLMFLFTLGAISKLIKKGGAKG
jgi:TRAP-type C4-dicarboxylate transport system permease small subunit